MTKTTGVDINRTIVAAPYAGGEGGLVQVATYDSNSHVQLYVTGRRWDGMGGKNTQVNICLSPEDADRVRDLLIAARPLPVAAPAPVTAKRATPKGAQQYKGNGKHEWEGVASDDHTVVYRLRVPGGWLYMTQQYADGDMGGDPLSVSTNFVPVPEVVGYAV